VELAGLERRRHQTGWEIAAERLWIGALAALNGAIWVASATASSLAGVATLPLWRW